MNQNNPTAFGAPAMYWKPSTNLWVCVLLATFLVLAIFWDAVSYTVDLWLNREEYSHGILIPFISGFLIWQKKNELAVSPTKGNWIGLVLVLVGLLVCLVGELSTLFIIQQYALLLVIFGVVLTIFGEAILKKVAMPLFLLFFAIPLPNFLYQGLSAKLQLWSTGLGVAVIRACDISVYQEGNVIDLGAMQLQVVEACSGLRYLFPLMSLAFICAYFFKASLWKRVIVFLSSIPITVLMNSFRIGMIGVLVEFFGKSMAEGFLHDFEGWIIFMVCTTILIAEMWLLARIGRDPRPLTEVFGLMIPEPLPSGISFHSPPVPKQYWALGSLLVATFLVTISLGNRDEQVPERQEFARFPLSLGDWTGRRQSMEQKYIDVLKFEDYILADYVKANTRAYVNFYSAYYESQRKGESIHSPRSCIPGGGWEITSLQPTTLNGLSVGGQPLEVNRLTIQKGEDRQLVYYWFQQRGRNLTNEYTVKWYLLWDALTMNRSDGALVRLTTFAPKGEDLSVADARLQDFLRLALPELDRYIPR